MILNSFFDQEVEGTSLHELLTPIESLGVPLLYEPLNRYETNMVCTLADGVALLKKVASKNIRLLADLYHMNIEEVDLAVSIRSSDRLLLAFEFPKFNVASSRWS